MLVPANGADQSHHSGKRALATQRWYVLTVLTKYAILPPFQSAAHKRERRADTQRTRRNSGQLRLYTLVYVRRACHMLHASAICSEFLTRTHAAGVICIESPRACVLSHGPCFLPLMQHRHLFLDSSGVCLRPRLVFIDKQYARLSVISDALRRFLLNALSLHIVSMRPYVSHRLFVVSAHCAHCKDRFESTISLLSNVTPSRPSLTSLYAEHSNHE